MNRKQSKNYVNSLLDITNLIFLTIFVDVILGMWFDYNSKVTSYILMHDLNDTIFTIMCIFIFCFILSIPLSIVRRNIKLSLKRY